MGCSVVSPQSGDGDPEALPPSFMHRTALRRAAAVVGVLPRSGFRIGFARDVASAVWGVGASPQVQFQVLPRSSSSGKGRQSLSVSELTAVTRQLHPKQIGDCA